MLLAQVKTEMQQQIDKLQKEIGNERKARKLLEKEVEKANFISYISENVFQVEVLCTECDT